MSYNNRLQSACRVVSFPRAALPGETIVRGPQLHYGENIPFLVSRWAQETPHAPAVAEGEYSLTYAELDSRSNELAHQLKLRGVAPDSLVALCLHRSITYVVAALGVMKAGGAYVPLEPSHPSQRLAFQLKDARAGVLVTTESIRRSKSLAAEYVIQMERNAAAGITGPSEPIPTEIRQEDLAYLIYTSGSTGQPKGVEITHGGLSNLVAWHIAAFQVTQSDRASHLASVGFDAAVWELWPYLAAGACVHIGDDWLARDPQRLRDWLLARGITCSFSPTRMAEHLMNLPWPADVPLRIMLTGGERLHRYPPRSLPFKVVNNYGPTECTVVATSSTLPAADCSDILPPIGTPIANTSIHILNEGMEPVRDGEDGEIWIGGPGLARGYRGRPELTAENFRSNSLDHESGSRLYRTGDRGRMLADGQLAFLGRADTQVKIRGHRTEPEEIEIILGQHPAVQESAVVACQVRPREMRLAAFVAERPDCELVLRDLQRYLEARVPEHMIPNSFSVVESLPLLPSGKIDRSSLRDFIMRMTPPRENWGDSQRRLESPPVFEGLKFSSVPMLNPRGKKDSAEGHETVPRDGVEGELTKIFQEILQVSIVPPHADFFLELGGDSLQAVQLFAEIDRVFGMKLPVSVLLEKRTMEGVAQELRNRQKSNRSPALVPLKPDGTQDPIFCIHSHDGEALFCRHLSDFTGVDRPVYAFQAPSLGGGPVHFSVEAAAACYVEELLRVQPEGVYSLFGFCYGGLVAFEMAQRLIAQGREVTFLCMFNTPAPGTLVGWPLGQFSYLGKRIGEEMRKMASLEAAERGRHLYRNAQDFWRMLVRSVKIDVWRLTGGAANGEKAQRLGRQMLDLEQIHIAAGKNYRPGGVFPGRITYMLSAKLPYPYTVSPEEGWAPFAAQGVETVAVQGAGEADPFRALLRTVASSLHQSAAAKSPGHAAQGHSLQCSPASSQ